MQVLLTIAAVFGLTAACSYIDKRFLGPRQTIGLMLLALGSTLALMLLNAPRHSGRDCRNLEYREVTTALGTHLPVNA